MGDIHDIAVLGILNDIFKYDVNLMITKVGSAYHATITWLGPLPDGNTGMGSAAGSDERLYHALSDAYGDMISKSRQHG